MDVLPFFDQDGLNDAAVLVLDRFSLGVEHDARWCGDAFVQWGKGGPEQKNTQANAQHTIAHSDWATGIQCLFRIARFSWHPLAEQIADVLRWTVWFVHGVFVLFDKVDR